MLGSLTRSFARMSCGPSTMASSSTSFFSNGSSLPHRPVFGTTTCASIFPSQLGSVRFKTNMAPRRVKYRKAHKIRMPFNTGGSIKGTTVKEGVYGIRLLAPAKLTAKQLEAAETAIKRKIKVIKGAQVFLRVFPDIPVCVKGNETRMGKGKGSFEYWACRAHMGKVIFEIGGPVDIRIEVAKEALRLAAAKLPVPTEFVTVDSPPRLGNLLLTSPLKSVSSPADSTSSTTSTA